MQSNATNFELLIQGKKYIESINIIKIFYFQFYNLYLKHFVLKFSIAYAYFSPPPPPPHVFFFVKNLLRKKYIYIVYVFEHHVSKINFRPKIFQSVVSSLHINPGSFLCSQMKLNPLLMIWQIHLYIFLTE